MRIELSTHKYSIETNFLIITPSRSAPYFLALSHRFCHLMLTSVTEARIFFNNHSHKETTFPPNESRPKFAPFNRPTLSAHVRTTRSLYHLLLKSLSGMVFICKQWSSKFLSRNRYMICAYANETTFFGTGLALPAYLKVKIPLVAPKGNIRRNNFKKKRLPLRAKRYNGNEIYFSRIIDFCIYL